MLTKAEEQELLEVLNDTSVGYPKNKTVVDFFEDQVKKSPDNIAVGFKNRSLTYSELNIVSNQLADYLRKTYDVKPDDLVGINLDRSEWLIIVMIGIIKSGGAYVPMDPDYPEERISYMTKDSACKVLIDQEELDHFIHVRGSYNPENNPVDLKPDNLIYCIYTSGSTGNPKGVLLEHYNIVRLLINDKPLFDFNDTDIWTMFHSYCFDFSVWEMYGALLFGGKVIVVPKMIAQDADAFLNLLDKEKVTVLNQTPSSFYNLIDSESRNNKAHLDIRYIIFGGEALQPARLAGWKAKFSDTQLINMYGITETTVHVTYKEIGIEEIENGASNIGKPIPTLSCYVLDEQQQLVPVGTVGELCVGGAGLARGYLNRPELTAERFIANPYKPGERLYRAGDLGRMLPDGNLEYLGRIDDQVKIRGFRIELGEIETALLKHDRVNAAVVIAREVNNADKELVAYTTGSAEASELRNYLKDKLPVYMVPGYYVRLDAIPLTSNGKVNRKILPVPEITGIDESAYVAPGTDIEKALVKIWSNVLGIEPEKISIKADFFDMGGHSIKAIQLVGFIHRELGVKLAIKELFSGSTIEQQAIITGRKEREAYEPIQTVQEQSDYPLSSSQQRLWVLNHFEGMESAYNIHVSVQLEGHLDKNALISAFKALILRHESLRTIFREDKNGRPHQLVLSIEKYPFQLEETDLREMADQEAQLQKLVDFEINSGFDLSKGPLLRSRLIQLQADKYVLVMVKHHIISDGWSMDVFRNDLSALYNAFAAGNEPQLAPLKIHYKDYAAWHARQLASANIAPQKDYWTQQFQGELPVLELPVFKDRPRVKSYNGATFTDKIDLEQLNNINKANGGTLFMSLIACLNTLFYRYSNQEDIIIGSPAAGREHPDLEGQIGFYINTLALRTRFNGNGSFRELYQQVKEGTLSAYDHQLYPYDELVDTLKLARDLSRNPLFDIMVVLQNSMEQDAEYIFDGLKTSAYTEGNYKAAKFDITLIFSESKDQLNLYLEYNTDVYTRQQMDQLLAHFKNIIASVADDPEQILSRIDLLSTDDKYQLLEEFNHTLVPYSKDKTITDLFEEQVLETPDATALCQHSFTMSYRELNEKANQLARYLMANGVNKGDNIGLLVTRGFDMMVGMYAIMKAGGAYVPIDPDYPIERQEYILGNSHVLKVMADGNYPLEKLVPAEQFIKMSTLDLGHFEKENPGIKVDPTQLAYTIYTSGSTGRPKGVMIEHHSAVNLIEWVNKEFNIGANDRILFVTSMCFDLSVYDIFGILAAGGSIAIVEQQELMDVPKLKDMLISYGITFWDSVPTTMDYLVRELEENDKNYLQETLRVVFMSGDWIPVNLPDRIRKYFPKTRVISLGGATEGTIWSNFYPIEKVENNWASIPYGRPMNNNFFYILNQQLQPVPIGVAGELYIGGVGVAKGYANDKEKTDYSFVKDIFHDQAGGRMYRTGDLGRMLPNLNMEFIGRLDDQVKIRGYRIELGEIESVLRQSEFISQAVVLAKTDKEGKKRLVCYVVGKEGYNRSEVISFLKSKLPDYMIPTLWLELDTLPLTSNNKIDKNALPDFNAEEQLKGLYRAPETESETEMAGIWQKVLKLKKIGVEDNFFDIGGHSLLAVQIITRIERISGKRFPITILFEYPTIRSLNNFIQKDSIQTSLKSLVPIKAGGNKMPLYIVHGIGLNVLNFSGLPLNVDKEQPLFGLQARGLDGITEPLDDFREIARYYVNEILEHNPNGPYALAGYSIGGIIAAEMVRILQEMNKDVKILVIFDTDAEETAKKEWYKVLPKKIKRYLPGFLGGTHSFTKQVRSIVNNKSKAISKKLGLLKETAESEAYYAMLDRIQAKLIKGYNEFRLTPINAEVHLFKARICVHFTDDTEYLNWRKYALKGVKTYTVGGDHLGMMAAPNVNELGRKLQEVLDKKWQE